MRSKFNSLKNSGLVLLDEGIRYHSPTDAWLSRSWNGYVESQPESSHDEYPSTSVSNMQKRPASNPVQQGEKRQRTGSHFNASTRTSMAPPHHNPSESQSHPSTSSIPDAGQDVTNIENNPFSNPTVAAPAITGSRTEAEFKTTSELPTWTTTYLHNLKATIRTAEAAEDPPMLELPVSQPTPRSTTTLDPLELHFRLDVLVARL